MKHTFGLSYQEVNLVTFLFCWCKDTDGFSILQIFAQKSLKFCAIMRIFSTIYVAQHVFGQF